MSITSNLSTTTKTLYTSLSALTLIGMLGIVGITANAGFFGGNEEVRAALESGDYEAFKSAVQVEDDQGRISRRFRNLDEEEFLRLQARFLGEEAIQDAIENDDYAAYQEAVEGLESEGIETRMGRRRGLKMIAETEEEFADLVAIYEEKEALQTELTAAVTAGDQAQFEALLQEQFASFEERFAETSQSPRRRPELTQQMFDTLYERAQEAVENGEEIQLRSMR